MSTWRYIFEQAAPANFTSNDLEFFQALNSLKQTNPNINSSDYYRYITEYILALKQYMPLLSDDAKAKINNNLEEINNIFKTANQNAFTVDATAYEEIKEDLSSVWKGVYGATPAAAAAPTTPAAAAATVSEPDQKTLEDAFAKYMGSSFNPNSSMDKGKMETVKKALADFQKQNNRPFKIEAQEDVDKMRPIMNAAYQSPEYKQAAGVGAKGTASGQGATRSSSAPRQQGTRQAKSLQLPVVGRGVEQMYVNKGGSFVQATDADYNSGQQLYAQKKKGTFDFLRKPEDRFQKVTRNRVQRAIRP
jgi:hypothetical protein